MKAAVVADTGGLLRALAARPDGSASFPSYAEVLKSGVAIIVPSLVLAEVDCFLRDERTAMRRFVAELFDPATTY